MRLNRVQNGDARSVWSACFNATDESFCFKRSSSSLRDNNFVAIENKNNEIQSNMIQIKTCYSSPGSLNSETPVERTKLFQTNQIKEKSRCV